MFERSKVGPAASVTPITPAKVLLVLDGSSQDDTACNAANHLQRRFRTETLILDARDQAEGNDTDLAIDRAAEIPASTPIARPAGESFDAILAVIDDHEIDLVVVPCPFGRSFEHVGVDSAGTVIDVLLSRCSKPMLVIRRDDQQLFECVNEVSMVIGSECDVETKAAAWIFGLAEKSATVTLNLVIEKENFENMRSIIEALHPEETLEPEQFSEALAKTHESLHGAMAKTASKLGMHYRLRPVAGEVAPPNPLSESSKMLLVMPLEVDDRFGQGFVHDRIRRSPHPVLVVPGHVPQ
jgi:hypothetical protein